MTISLKDNAASGSSFSFDTTVGKIGEGRHVNAYLAQYSWTQGTKPVVVKMPKAASLTENQRIQRQADAPTGGECLPCVVAVIPVEKTSGAAENCIAVDYIRGITLTQFINGILKPKFEDTYVNVQSLHNRYRIRRDKIACQIVKGVAAAIKQMHDAGISHEELTADDVLITADGGVALTGTGQAMPNGRTGDDLYRIGVVAYQLCVANCDLGQVDIGNVASAQMQDFIRKALGHGFGDIDEVIAALGRLTTFDHGKVRKGLFGGKRNSIFTVDTRQYGVFVPEEPPVLQGAVPVAIRKSDAEASGAGIPGLHPAWNEAPQSSPTREEARDKAGAEARRIRAEQEAARKAAEAKAEAERAKAEEARAKAEAERKAKQEAEKARAKAEAEARRIKAEQEAARKAAEAKAEAERAKAEEARAKAETERKAKQEAEEARAKAEAEARRIKAEQEAARKAAEAKAETERAKAEEARAKAEAERKAKQEAEKARAKAEAEARRIKAEQEAARKAAEAKAEAERAKAEAESRKAKEEAERQAKLKAQQEIERIKKEAKRREEDIRRKAQKEREARLQAEAEAKKAKARNNGGKDKDKQPAVKNRKIVFGGIAAAAAVLLLVAVVAMRPENTKISEEAKTQTVTTEVKKEKTTVPVSNSVNPQTSIPTGGTGNSGNNIFPANAVGSKETGKTNVATSEKNPKQKDRKQGSKKNKTAMTNRHTNNTRASRPQQPQEDEIQKKGANYRLSL